VRRGVLRATATLPLAQARGETMTTARILIVEDEHLIALGLSRRVIALDYTVVGLAASGEEAIAQAAGLQPDVVLMDIGLRGVMDGIEAARHIRAWARFRSSMCRRLQMRRPWHAPGRPLPPAIW
jgi:CheY-like chemotaxis protein